MIDYVIIMFCVIFIGLSGMMWIDVIDWIKKTNQKNLKLNDLARNYYSETFQINTKNNMELTMLMHGFLNEMRAFYMEDKKRDEIQSEENHD